MREYAIALAILVAPVIFVLTNNVLGKHPLERRVELCVRAPTFATSPPAEVRLLCEQRFWGMR
jgi:hypothetical protein